LVLRLNETDVMSDAHWAVLFRMNPYLK